METCYEFFTIIIYSLNLYYFAETVDYGQLDERFSKIDLDGDKSHLLSRNSLISDHVAKKKRRKKAVVTACTAFTKYELGNHVF